MVATFIGWRLLNNNRLNLIQIVHLIVIIDQWRKIKPYRFVIDKDDSNCYVNLLPYQSFHSLRACVIVPNLQKYFGASYGF